MHPLLSLSCANEPRRSAIADALARGGLELTDPNDDLATIHIDDGSNALTIRTNDELLIQLSVSLEPDDVVGLARVALELATLWGVVRSFDDSESIGVIAADVAHDARNALVPVIFAADALAVDYPAAKELTTLLIAGCDQVATILHRIIRPSETRIGTTSICATTVVNGIAGTLRALARRAKIVTRLETPLPLIAIDRSELERMLLTVVANAADARRNTGRIVVTTSSREVTRVDAREAPIGDWVVIEVEDDGLHWTDADLQRALTSTFTPPPRTSRGLGLAGVAQRTRAAGGHFSIDNQRRGAKIAIWLPLAST